MSAIITRIHGVIKHLQSLYKPATAKIEAITPDAEHNHSRILNITVAKAMRKEKLINQLSFRSRMKSFIILGVFPIKLISSGFAASPVR